MNEQVYPECWYDLLEEEPDNWEVYGILADWYEDQGNYNWGEAIRWQIAECYYPGRVEDREEYGWCYWESDKGTVLANLPNVLPHRIFKLFKDYKIFTIPPTSISFRTVRKALEYLWNAYTCSKPKPIRK